MGENDVIVCLISLWFSSFCCGWRGDMSHLCALIILSPWNPLGIDSELYGLSRQETHFPGPDSASRYLWGSGISFRFLCRNSTLYLVPSSSFTPWCGEGNPSTSMLRCRSYASLISMFAHLCTLQILRSLTWKHLAIRCKFKTSPANVWCHCSKEWAHPWVRVWSLHADFPIKAHETLPCRSSY